MEGFDLITMGRAGVDLYPTQVGKRLSEVALFRRYLGGSPTNVAVAAARLGRRTAVVTRTGADPFGEFVHEALRGYGVDDRFVEAVVGAPTPITFCEMFPPDDFPIYFYRDPRSPDLQVAPGELDVVAIAQARVFWVTVTGLSVEPSRSATLAALGARERPAMTVLDLDYRKDFWPSVDAARIEALKAIRSATIVVGNLRECQMAVDGTEPAEIAAALRSLGPELVVVKLGPDGVLVHDGDEVLFVEPIRVDVVNGLGAGDAFGGAMCHGLLGNWTTRDAIEFANAAGAIVATRIACSEAMPTEAEVLAMLDTAASA